MRETTAAAVARLTGYANLNEDELWTKEASPLLRLIVSTTEEVTATERELERAADRLREIADRIMSNIKPVEGKRIYGLNSTGELDGSAAARTDMLIVRREQQIRNLQGLIWLLRQERGEA